MQYKLMILEMLQQYPEIYSHLATTRQLPQAIQSYTNELSQRHTAWEEFLQAARPESSPPQVASEALELAREDLRRILAAEFLLDSDAAMAFRQPMRAA